MKLLRSALAALAALSLLAAAGCGDGTDNASGSSAGSGAGSSTLSAAAAPGGAPAAVAEAAAQRQNSAGQVATGTVARPAVSAYAAARFLEQASFGPTPASIARVRQIGYAAWIDEQLAAPVSQLDSTPMRSVRNPVPSWVWRYSVTESYRPMLSAPDQLRLRASWALSQFIVVSSRKVQEVAAFEYLNLLQRHALDSYADLLRAVTISAPMGLFLDNAQNRPLTACPTCSPNENYAREVMQLFSVGVTLLNRDGSVQRDARGRPIPTYGQEDVEQLARALTGWDMDNQNDQTFRNTINWALFDRPMVPSPWQGQHDDGSKRVLGVTIPAGQGPRGDLDSVVAILTGHPNAAPFVSLRMIQHFVTSDPSPAYIGRIAAVFENDGSGRRGNLGAVIKAILLDPEARRGDTPGAVDQRVGKIREPVLWYTGLLRGMGCSVLPSDGSNPTHPWRQTPLSAPSVFSYYLPSDRAAGSLLLSPEERMLHSGEFSMRFGMLNWLLSSKPSALGDAGCGFSEFVDAYRRSPNELLALISDRYLRGSMSPSLRATALEVLTKITWGTPEERTALVLQFVLASPAYGVMK